MTREEAIEEIRYYCQNSEEIIEAINQSSEDCVSREELKKWLDMNFSFGGALRKLEMFDQIDKELPPVTPTQRWIPVSERLPEEDEVVLGTNSSNDLFQTYIWDDCGEIKWYADGCFDVPVVAWMALPKSYEEMESEE